MSKTKTLSECYEELQKYLEENKKVETRSTVAAFKLVGLHL